MTAKTLLSHSFRIAGKDLTELFRNRLGLVMLVLMPIFMMSMVGFIYPSSGSTVSNLPIALVNEDRGYWNSTIPSQTLVTLLQQINSKTGMMVLSNASRVDDLKSLVQKGDIDGGIELAEVGLSRPIDDDFLVRNVSSLSGVVSVEKADARNISIKFSGGNANQERLLTDLVELKIGVTSFRLSSSALEDSYLKLIKDMV
jgi:hypothetical protein